MAHNVIDKKSQNMPTNSHSESNSTVAHHDQYIKLRSEHSLVLPFVQINILSLGMS